MEDISLHILDIAENSVAAGATLIEITIVENTIRDMLSVFIEDNGKGIPEKLISEVLSPFYTTKTTRKVGLGLSLLAQSAKEAEGDISIQSRDSGGTSIKVYFKHSHIDRKPLGNIADTFTVLIAGNPEIDFIFSYSKNNNNFFLDSREIKSALGSIPINSSAVISIIRENLQEFINSRRR